MEVDHYSMPPDWQSSYEAALIRIEYDRHMSVMEETVFLWKMPRYISGLLQPVLISIDSVRQGANGTAVVSLSTTALALYVVLTSRAQGRFNENAVVLKPMVPRVRAIMFWILSPLFVLR